MQIFKKKKVKGDKWGVRYRFHEGNGHAGSEIVPNASDEDEYDKYGCIDEQGEKYDEYFRVFDTEEEATEFRVGLADIMTLSGKGVPYESEKKEVVI